MQYPKIILTLVILLSSPIQIQGYSLEGDYLFNIETHDFDVDVVIPYFGNIEFAEDSNVYDLVNTRMEDDSYFGVFSQGYWDMDAGSYSENEGYNTQELNLTWTFVYPISGLDDWVSYGQVRDGEINTIFEFSGVSDVTISNRYYEKLTMDDEGFAELYIDIDTGILTSFFIHFNNNSDFTIWSVDKSQFSEYTSPAQDKDGFLDSNKFMIIGAGIFVIAVTIFIRRKK